MFVKLQTQQPWENCFRAFSFVFAREASDDMLKLLKLMVTFPIVSQLKVETHLQNKTHVCIKTNKPINYSSGVNFDKGS